MTDLHGALLIDKPVGWTSHDVVARIRSRCKVKKAGHCGTLDPNATGLLVILIGKATKMSERFMKQDKYYEGIARFGEVTDSYDADGTITATRPVPPLSIERLNKEAQSFVGDIFQTPPMVSAVKVDGVPLYKLARKGKTVERKPRLVHIYRFQFTAYAKPEGRFSVACTKGVYARSLVHELGAKLGCGAHLKTLRRTQSGSFRVSQALAVDSIGKMSAAEVAGRVIPMTQLARFQQAAASPD